MEKFILLFQEYLLKAVTMTETIIESDFSSSDRLDHFTANRDRLFGVINQISQKIEWHKVSEEQRNEFNRQIEYIKKLDEKLLVKLQEYQIKIKQELEKTHRQRENVKGYNLTDVK